MDRPKVLSIVGPGRSGTTIVAGVLGEVDGVCNVGELRWLWRRGVLERRPCGCGLPPEECPVWSRVLAKVDAGGTATPEEIAAAQGELASRRRRLRVIRSATGGDSGWPPLERLRAVTGELVAALTEVTDARVVVDNSKRALDAAVFAGLGQVDHYVLHILRDPAAVAFSWRRRDKTVQTQQGSRTMTTRRLLPSVERWSENCLSAEALRRHIPPDRWMFLRYEDFVAAPRDAISRVLDFIGERGSPPFVGDASVLLRLQHTVAGNPVRFRVGEIRIAPDDEWRTRTPWLRRLVIRTLTWPLLLRYGYPLVRRSG